MVLSGHLREVEFFDLKDFYFVFEAHHISDPKKVVRMAVSRELAEHIMQEIYEEDEWEETYGGNA